MILVRAIRDAYPMEKREQLCEALILSRDFAREVESLKERVTPEHFSQSLELVDRVIAEIKSSPTREGYLFFTIGLSGIDANTGERARLNVKKAVKTLADYISDVISNDEPVSSSVISAQRLLTDILMYIVEATLNDDDHLSF